jgi:hypothetical protein
MCIYTDLSNAGCINSALLLMGMEGLVICGDELHQQTSCLYRASIVSKHFFIIPTYAHNYKIIGMLKTSGRYRTLAQQAGMPP